MSLKFLALKKLSAAWKNSLPIKICQLEGFKKFGKLPLKFRYALNIKSIFFGSQISSSSHLLWLIPGERGPPLK